MGLLNKKEQTPQSPPNQKHYFNLVKTPKEGSIISKCVNLSGEIKSCEDIIVDGKVKGDISTSNTLIISSNGVVSGKVTANEVRVDGTLVGPIEATKVEITKGGKTTGYIVANMAKIDGYINGDIICKDSLEIEQNAIVTTPKSVAKFIKIRGSIEGKVIAKELLELLKGGRCKGEIAVKVLRTEIGSILEGSISKYSPTQQKDSINEISEVKKPNKTREIKVIKPKKK